MNEAAVRFTAAQHDAAYPADVRSHHGPNRPLLAGIALCLAACGSSAGSVANTTSTVATVATNTWKAPGSVMLTALPVGDGNTSTTTAKVGSILSCTAGDPNA
ncbi:MAG TPA: hypothetical protein VGM78_14900, partial [Ilumatobacteraceae bacterium]